jgi:hypothetical protein
LRTVVSVCYKTLLALTIRGFPHARKEKKSDCETHRNSHE